MTTRAYEPEDLSKALELSGAEEVGTITTEQARDTLILLGLTVKPERPEPGTWHIVKDGDYEGYPARVFSRMELHIFHPTGAVHSITKPGFWPSLTPATPPARVVPAEPVALSNDEVDAIWEEVDGHAPAPIGVRGTVNAAIAKHGHGRALPDSRQVREAIDSGFSLAESTDAVMALLKGGDRD